jgi:trans-aconitate methyltransferase
MILKLVKRSVRRIGRRLLPNGNAGRPGTEVAAGWYDEVYKEFDVYRQPFYESPYYPTWIVIADRLHRYNARRILDIGCGPGQFAQLLQDWGFQQYTGLDFSAQAIEMAKSLVPAYEFVVGDARSPDAYRNVEYDALVCTEVLEHVSDDFGVVSCFAPGSRCLCTVPNFPFTSHVRHFASAAAAEERYARFFTDLTVTRLKGTRSRDEQYFLLDGVRNSYTCHADSEDLTA